VTQTIFNNFISGKSYAVLVLICRLVLMMLTSRFIDVNFEIIEVMHIMLE